jgi:hypothetical protein
VIVLPLTLAVALGSACAAQSSPEDEGYVASALKPADAGRDSALDGVVAALNSAEAGRIDEAKAQEELRLRNVSGVLVLVSNSTSVSDQVLGTKIEAHGEAKLLGAIEVKVEGQGEHKVGERLVIKIAEGKFIVAGDPATVKAALDAIRAGCLARVKAKAFGPIFGEMPVETVAVECCAVLSSFGMKEE